MVEARERREQRQFVALHWYYLVDSDFCRPSAGCEEGGVEPPVGFSSSNFLGPIHQVAPFGTGHGTSSSRCTTCHCWSSDRGPSTMPGRCGSGAKTGPRATTRCCGCCASSGRKAGEESRSSCGCCAYMSSIQLTWCNTPLSKRSPTVARTWMACCIACINEVLTSPLCQRWLSPTTHTCRRLAASPLIYTNMNSC